MSVESEAVLVTLQDRSRVNLGKLARHDRYLVRCESDGTLIWEPAEVVSAAETRLLANKEIMAVIAESRAHPERLVHWDRSGAPRA